MSRKIATEDDTFGTRIIINRHKLFRLKFLYMQKSLYLYHRKYTRKHIFVLKLILMAFWVFRANRTKKRYWEEKHQIYEHQPNNEMRSTNLLLPLSLYSPLSKHKAVLFFFSEPNTMWRTILTWANIRKKLRHFTKKRK